MRRAATEERSPLLCIVDPSLKDFVGHHFEYDAAVASGARDLGYEVICLANGSVQKAISDVLAVRPAFTHDIWGVQELYAGQPRETAYKAANRSFLADLDRATRDLVIDEHSIIFGHMITAAQLEGWAAFARRTRTRRPTIVLLCRYELAHYRGETGTRAFRELERLKRAGVRIRLATDSERLSRHFSRLTSLPVEVFPIPHTQRHAPVDAKPGWSGASPLVVSMLGNARDEKGWVELIGAIQVLAAQGRARDFNFIIQANDPDAACTRALSRMGSELDAYIELKTFPLEPAAYATLLGNSDIVVLPYWRSIYEARTSGVLVEALSAGKPVICTEATWLGDQIDASRGRWVKDRNPADLARQLWEMRADYDRYSAGAHKAREPWVAYHNPASFAAALTQGAPSTRPDGLRVAMFYPWGDAQTRGSGASLRLNLLAHYLFRRVESVTVLEDARRAPKTIDGVDFEAYALLEQGDMSRVGQWLRRWMPKLLGIKNGEELYPLLHLYPRFNLIFRRHLEEVVRSSDVVFLEYAFWGSVLGPICRGLDKPLIITAHDVVADQVRSSRVARWLTARMELRGLRQARNVAVVSAADQTAFANRGVESTLIPQFIDVKGLRATPKVERAVLNRLIDLPEADRTSLFVFIGSRFRPNEVAAAHLREIAAATRAKHPDLAFRIVVAGSCCAEVRDDAFAAVGYVDDAVLPLLYQHATMVVIPLTMGTGASLKTVEAFGAGAPVLGTSIAFRGFEIAPGVDCLLEDDLAAWPDRLAELTRDLTISEGLRAGAVRRGHSYDYVRACEAYLSLAPEIGAQAAPDARQAAIGPTQPILTLVRAGWKAGLSEAVAPYLDDLRRANASDCSLKQIHAELLANGTSADVAQAMRLFEETFEAGGDPEPNLYGHFKTCERLGDVREADRTARLAARLFTLQTAHQDRDAAVREALWKRFHAGERSWVYVIAREIALVGHSVHIDYHHLFSLLEMGEGADHALGLAHAEIALAAGFDQYWSLSLIARHQAALGRTADAMDTLAQATDVAKDEEQRRSVIDTRLLTIWKLFHARKLEEAFDEASRLIIDAPELGNAYYIKAECSRLLNAPLEDSIADYERAEKAGYDPAWCKLHSGRLLADAMRLGDAAERLMSATPIDDPHQIQCWRDGMTDVASRGVDHMPLSHLRPLIAEAVLLDPANRDLTLRLRAFGPDPTTVPLNMRRDHLDRIVGSTFQERNYRLVLAQGREAQALFPDEPIFLYYIAECLQLLNKELDLADEHYSRAIELSMEPFWPLMNRGQLRRKLGQLEKARIDIEAALQAARNPLESAQAAKSLEDLEAQCSELV